MDTKQSFSFCLSQRSTDCRPGTIAKKTEMTRGTVCTAVVHVQCTCSVVDLVCVHVPSSLLPQLCGVCVHVPSSLLPQLCGVCVYMFPPPSCLSCVVCVYMYPPPSCLSCVVCVCTCTLPPPASVV